MKTESRSGFTIIETLLVLAIAGLILLIVLLLVPQLQRTSRNNMRKQDVSTLLDYVSTYLTNNSGNMPSTATFLQGSKLKYYDASAVDFSADVTDGISIRAQQRGTGGGSTVTNTSIDSVWIYNYRKCQPAGNSATPNAAGYRDIVAVYGIENSGASASKCQQL